MSEFKFKNAALLNRLSEMQQAPYYATARHTLADAESVIVQLERKNAELQAQLELAAHSLVEADETYDELTAAAEAVTWFDWSGNDSDAVAAVEKLRAAIEKATT